MTFGPGNVVPMAENAAAAIVKRAVEDAPPAVSRAALGEALVRAGLLLLEQECGHVEATRVVLGALPEATEAPGPDPDPFI